MIFETFGTFGAKRAPILRQDSHYHQTDRKGHPLEPHRLGVPSSASQTISEAMVRSVQTVHLSCTDTNTASKQAKMRFRMTHVTYDFYRVRPKRFLSLWYVWPKPSTYLAPIVTLFPNSLKRNSTWPMSPRSSIGCVQNNF
jgi:hypothetical protein